MENDGSGMVATATPSRIADGKKRKKKRLSGDLADAIRKGRKK